MTRRETHARELEQAAELWVELRLPLFEVEGYLDGVPMRWNIAEALRVAAERLRQGPSAERSDAVDAPS